MHCENVHFLVRGTTTTQFYRWRIRQGSQSQGLRRQSTVYGLSTIYHGQCKQWFLSIMGPLFRGLPPNYHCSARIADRIQCLFKYSTSIPTVKGTTSENRPRIEYTTPSTQPTEDWELLPSRLPRSGKERNYMSKLAEIGGSCRRTDGGVGGNREGITHTLPL